MTLGVARMTLALMVVVGTTRLHAQDQVTQGQPVTRHLGGDSSQAAIVYLRGASVYRIEVSPAQALVRIHLRSRYQERPLDQLGASGAAAAKTTFVVVAPSDGEYIVELTNPGAGMTSVTLTLDNQPDGANAGAIAARHQASSMGVELRGVLQTSHEDVTVTYDSIRTGSSDVGAELCVGGVPRGLRSLKAFGGCFVTLGAFHRGDGRNYVAIGIEPRFRLTALGATGGLSAVGHFSFSFSQRWSIYYGLGLQYAWPISASTDIVTEAAIMRIYHIQLAASPFDDSRATDTYGRLSFGFRLHR